MVGGGEEEGCGRAVMTIWSSRSPSANCSHELMRCCAGSAAVAQTVLRVADLEMDLLARIVRRSGTKSYSNRGSSSCSNAS